MLTTVWCFCMLGLHFLSHWFSWLFLLTSSVWPRLVDSSPQGGNNWVLCAHRNFKLADARKIVDALQNLVSTSNDAKNAMQAVDLPEDLSETIELASNRILSCTSSSNLCQQDVTDIISVLHFVNLCLVQDDLTPFHVFDLREARVVSAAERYDHETHEPTGCKRSSGVRPGTHHDGNHSCMEAGECNGGTTAKLL
jgi:hypothetical protein